MSEQSLTRPGDGLEAHYPLAPCLPSASSRTATPTVVPTRVNGQRASALRSHVCAPDT